MYHPFPIPAKSIYRFLESQKLARHLRRAHVFKISFPESGKMELLRELRSYGFNIIRGQQVVGRPLNATGNNTLAIAATLVKEKKLKDCCYTHKTESSTLPRNWRIAAQADKRISEIKSIIEANYRTTKGRGGETKITVFFDSSPHAEGKSERVWVGKWSGNNTIMNIHVSPAWARNVASVPGLANASGMLTTHAHQIAPDLWEASWVRQGRGFALRTETGVILRAENGWVHAKNEREAQAILARRTKK